MFFSPPSPPPENICPSDQLDQKLNMIKSVRDDLLRQILTLPESTPEESAAKQTILRHFAEREKDIILTQYGIPVVRRGISETQLYFHALEHIERLTPPSNIRSVSPGP